MWMNSIYTRSESFQGAYLKMSVNTDKWRLKIKRYPQLALHVQRYMSHLADSAVKFQSWKLCGERRETLRFYDKSEVEQNAKDFLRIHVETNNQRISKISKRLSHLHLGSIHGTSGKASIVFPSDTMHETMLCCDLIGIYSHINKFFINKLDCRVLRKLHSNFNFQASST